jgi:hypothetical protein
MKCEKRTVVKISEIDASKNKFFFIVAMKGYARTHSLIGANLLIILN